MSNIRPIANASFRIGVLLLIVGIVMGVGVRVVFGINILGEGYKIINSAQQIKAYNTCYNVSSTDGKSYFLPTKTSGEFSTFVSNKPSGVNLSQCVMLAGGRHTVEDCRSAGGTPSGSYCYFAGSSCGGGWAHSGYSDYYYFSKSCSATPVNCNHGNAYNFQSSCFTGGNQAFFSTGSFPPSCSYTQTNSYYGAWDTYDLVCGTKYVCDFFGKCSWQYTCTSQWVVHWGTICNGTSYLTCTANSPSITGVYCY